MKPPQDHPISLERAKELLAGDLGRVMREILFKTCAPVFWWKPPSGRILNSGTVTFVKTDSRLLGITAAHVVRGFQKCHSPTIRLQMGNAVLDDLTVIACSDPLDLATIEISGKVLRSLGKEISPVSFNHHLTPQSGRSLTFAGFPGVERNQTGNELCFGIFTALGIASCVSDEQITFKVDRENLIETSVPNAPPGYPLGGISGGPMLAWFETKSHLAYTHLTAIISQSHDEYENVIGKRTHFICDDGSICEPMTRIRSYATLSS